MNTFMSYRRGVSMAKIGSSCRDGITVHDDGTVIPAPQEPPRIGRLHGCDNKTAGVRYRRIVEANVFGIGYGRERLLIDANAALMAAIGAQPVDLEIGIPLHVLFAIDDAAVDTLLDGRTRAYDITRVDGTQAHLVASRIPLHADDWLLLAVDLSERKAAERAIRHLALHDPTTGVPNRRLLMDRLEHALARASREHSITAVLFCDIDRFKEINDAYGHRAGDAVLQTTAQRLGEVLRHYDTVARVGGDEFVVLLERLANPTDAAKLAERARLALSEPIAIDNTDIHVTVSIGVALTVAAAHNPDTLLRRADDAMYDAKDRGRNQVAFRVE
jgi:diguanylate cyclase (GGDEF)-like protein